MFLFLLRLSARLGNQILLFLFFLLWIQITDFLDLLFYFNGVPPLLGIEL